MNFRAEQALDALKSVVKIKEKKMNVVLSELKKEGLLKVEFDPDDSRKRFTL